MIRVRNLSCGYGSRMVLEDVSLCVEGGEMVGLLGPNGSGKTTLLSALCGMLPLRTGEVRIRERPVHAMRPRERARLVACVPQRVDAVFDMEVRALVLMGRYPHTGFLGGYSVRDHEAAEAAMRATGVLQFRNRRAGQLSGGEFQRVLMARALAQETDLLFLDEAGSGLDIGHKVEIYDLIRERNRCGVTVLSVIHDLNLAAAYCDRLIFLKNGRVVEDGPTRDVFTEPILSRIYETDVLVADHPGSGMPQCFLVPGGGVAAAGAGRAPGDRDRYG